MAFYGFDSNPYDEQREAPGYTCQCGGKWEDIIGAETQQCEWIEGGECEKQVCAACNASCSACGIRVCGDHLRRLGKAGERKDYCLTCAKEQQAKEAA